MTSFSTQTPATSLQIDSKRLRKHLEELSAIGLNDDGGIYRMFGSDAEKAARAWYLSVLEKAGLPTRRDGALNLFGRYGKAGTACVMSGSHIDSVPRGGHLDGALGVVAGLECVLRAKELGLTLKRPLECAVFTDEEGRFGGMFGSQAMCGFLTPGFIHTASDQDDHSLADVLAGYDAVPMDILGAQRTHEDVEAFVELHIEQGPVLATHREQIGVVTAITGLMRWNVTFLGMANHAGTTPMNMRKDALAGLAEVSSAIGRIVEEDGGPDSCATIGRVSCFPGAPNVVPGRVDFTLDIRDTSPQVLEQLRAAFSKALSAIARRRGLQVRYEDAGDLEPVRLDAGIQSLIGDVATELGLRARSMPSGAAHDAQQLARMTRAGMIFVPSKDGRSHSPEEWTAWDDIVAGTNTLFNVLVRLANA